MTDNQILTRYDAASTKSKRRKHKVRKFYIFFYYQNIPYYEASLLVFIVID